MHPFEWRQLLGESDLPPTVRLVGHALADHADATGKCWPSVDRLVRWSGLSRASIKRALAALEVNGLILRFKRTGAKGHRSSLFRLTAPVDNPVENLWTTCGDSSTRGLTVSQGGAHCEPPIGGLTVSPRTIPIELRGEPPAELSTGGARAGPAAEVADDFAARFLKTPPPMFGGTA
ncbi:MAG: Helix-turn-helix domain [Actinomycetota bacterium]